MSRMTRERQRELGTLRAQIERLRRDGYSTLPATVHVAADTLELAEAEIFRDYSPKKRRRMASTGVALPDGSYPIPDRAAAEDAIRALGRATDQERVTAHIRKRVWSLRCQGEIFDPYR